MSELFITPENCEYYTGAGQREYSFDGQPRILNAMPQEMIDEIRAEREIRGVSLVSRPFEDAFPLIPRDEWVDRIREKDANGSWLRNINDLMGVPCLDQNSLGFCHAYGTVGAAMTSRAIAGLPTIILSPESVGGRVTGWRNRGANPDDDLEVLVKYGACRMDMMDKVHSLDPDRWQRDWEQDALNHAAVEVFHLSRERMFDELMTCALLNIPTGVWFNWWGHHVQGPLAARHQESKFWLCNRNSWGTSYGENGYFWMQEGIGRGQATASGAHAIRVMKPSET